MQFKFRNNKTFKTTTITAKDYLAACSGLLKKHNIDNHTSCTLHDINNNYKFIG